MKETILQLGGETPSQVIASLVTMVEQDHAQADNYKGQAIAFVNAYIVQANLAAQEQLLDEIEKETQLEWYLRNEYNDECNAQESGEVAVAGTVRDFIANKRQALQEKREL